MRPAPTALFDHRAADGSRQFAEVPDVWGPAVALRDHAAALPGARVTGFVTDHVTECWLDLRYRGHRFTLNTQFEELWLFVDDPGCPDEVLRAVAGHFSV